MKDRKLLLNTSTAFVYQIVTLVCGFVLPKFFLITYGSEINGLVTSIAQFLGFISLMDLGISAVVKSSLYEPLAKNDNRLLSAVMISTKRFYSRIIILFLFYLIFLCILYPFKVKYDFLFTVTLILSMSISIISQYYFGITNQCLLEADQRNYIASVLNIVTLILNTVCSVWLMVSFHASIQTVKLVTSIIYIMRPLYMMLYVKKHYSIDYKIHFVGEPIKQKWNGILQHLASVVLQNTDVFILTIFSTLKNISIYNIYSLVVLGVRNLVVSLTSGMQSKFGHLLAVEKYRELNYFFDKIEFLLHGIITLVFTATAVLIVPFVQVYTYGINDANYVVPLFGLLISLAQMFYCLRLPYSMLVLAAGHFKETQRSALIEMILNIVISIVLVWNCGLWGVAVGTLVAMGYRTVYYVIYISKNILNRNIYIYIKYMFVNSLVFILSLLLCGSLSLNNLTYLSWIFLAIKSCVIICAVFIIVNLFFFKENIKNIVKKKV